MTIKIKNNEFQTFIKEIKQKIYSAKNRAVLSANRVMIELYFKIGKEIVKRQEKYGWGKSIVEKISKELKKEFGEKSGYSTQNLWYMRQFYLTYKDNENLQQFVGEISWSANILIFSKCKDIEERKYYIKKLLNLAGIDEKFKERKLEKSILDNLQKFLVELGVGFCFVGNQYKLSIGEKDYFIDLLFFHRKLNSLVAIELKIGEFKPEYAGKMNFYLNILNDKVKMEHENPAIGIILCTNKNNIEVEYALQNLDQAMGVSAYITKQLPKDLKYLLPTKKEFETFIKNYKRMGESIK